MITQGEKDALIQAYITDEILYSKMEWTKDGMG